MRLNYIHMIVVLLIVSCHSEDDTFREPSDKPDSNIKLAELYESGSNQRYDWPPSMLRDNAQDIWGKGVIGKKLHDWPNVVPWAKSGSPLNGRRNYALRKKRRNVIDGSGLVDLDPQTFNDRHKVIAPKLRSNRRLWPYYLY